MTQRENFEKRVHRSLNSMEAKISYLNEGVKGLNEAFKDFREDMVEYMTYSADQYADHEKRIKNLETKIKE